MANRDAETRLTTLSLNIVQSGSTWQAETDRLRTRMSAIINPRYTLDEYFELELSSEEKYEYFNGEVFCMSGVKRNHSLATGNIFNSLKNALGTRGCEIHASDLRVKTPSMPPYRYPDVVVVCDRPQFEEIGGLDVLLNPVLIVEVLSPSTEAYDRGDKFTYYKSIPSFREYLLVAQHRPHITHYVKAETGKWDYEETNDLTSSIYLSTIACTLALSEVYRDVEFSQDETPISRGTQ